MENYGTQKIICSTRSGGEKEFELVSTGIECFSQLHNGSLLYPRYNRKKDSQRRLLDPDLYGVCACVYVHSYLCI